MSGLTDELQLGAFCKQSWDDKVQFGQTAAYLAVAISLAHILRHCCCSRKRGELLRMEIVILSLVPLYALNAQYCLTKVTNLYMLPELVTLLREFYESFALAAFVNFILTWLGGFRFVVKQFMREQQMPQHVWVTCFPRLVNWCPSLGDRRWMPFRPGGHLIRGILFGMLQYTVVSAVVSVVSVILWASVVSHSERGALASDMFINQNGVELYKKVQTPLLAIKGASVGLAMYCTILLLAETERNQWLHVRLEQSSPHSKFLAIKILVFATMIQKTLCEKVLPIERLGLLPKVTSCVGEDMTADEIGIAIQNFVLCFELLVFALVHLCVYPVYETHDAQVQVWCEDGNIAQMRSFRRKERELKLTCKRFLAGEGLDQAQAPLEELFSFFHPQGKAELNPIEFGFLLQRAGYDAEPGGVIERLQRRAEERGGYISCREFAQYARPEAAGAAAEAPRQHAAVGV